MSSASPSSASGPSGACARGPTQAIRPSLTATVPCSIGGALMGSTHRAWYRIKAWCRGRGGEESRAGPRLRPCHALAWDAGLAWCPE